jgi:flagellar biogenesis protein FliO
MLAQVVGASPSPLGELGPGIAGSTLAVLLLLVATLVVLRVAARNRGRTRLQGPGGLLSVVAQLELAPSQQLYLVRAAGRCLLVGGTSGGLGLIAELDPQQVEALDHPQPGAGTLAERLRASLLGVTTRPPLADPPAGGQSELTQP